jgi:uncharacterized protein with ParB-like and HNH nuclease domain
MWATGQNLFVRSQLTAKLLGRGAFNMQIRQIIDKINDSQLFVPAFQREYVWKRADAKALFTSLIKKYPTGTLLSWETTQPPELKGRKKYTKEMGAVKLILDGQQRITTIYMIVEGKLPPYYTQADIKNEVTGLYVNLQTLDLEYYKQQAMQNNPLWVDLTDIFQGRVKSSDVRKGLKATGALDDELENIIDNNFEAVKSIQEREFPEQIIPISASIKEAIDIFYIVNASGVNLTDAELALAQISGYWPEARDLFKKKLFALEKEGFVFKLDFIIFALLAVTHSNGSEMKRLHGVENAETIKAAWKRLDEQVLDYVVNVLRMNAYVDHTDEINSTFALIPIIAYVFKKPNGKLNELEIKKLTKWFYYSQLRQRYASQTPQKLDKDLAVVKSSTEPFDELLGIIEQERPLKISESEFVGRDIRHPLFNLMKWYFKSQDAVCLGTGVSIRRNMGKKYTLEKDHIFPYAALGTGRNRPLDISKQATLMMEHNSTGGNLHASLSCDWGSHARRARSLNGRRSQKNPKLVDSALESPSAVSSLQDNRMGCGGLCYRDAPSRLRCLRRWIARLSSGDGGLQVVYSHHVFQCSSHGRCRRIQRHTGSNRVRKPSPITFPKGGVRQWQATFPRSRMMFHQVQLCAPDTWGAR